MSVLRRASSRRGLERVEILDARATRPSSSSIAAYRSKSASFRPSSFVIASAYSSALGSSAEVVVEEVRSVVACRTTASSAPAVLAKSSARSTAGDAGGVRAPRVAPPGFGDRGGVARSASGVGCCALYAR